jgi:murein DD-endopeptidase MepM/ murein hydrolase activator NlpD
MRLEHKVALNTVLFLAVLVGAGVLSTAMRRVDSLAGGQTLIVPVLGVRAEQLVDSWGAPRGRKRVHKGIDIMAREGTPVRAAMAGTIAKLFRSKHGGVTVYQFDPGGRLVLYYAHLKGYAWSLREGDKIAQGQMIGTVGRTGNATTPHLHFEILHANDKRQWWRGRAINPYWVLKAGQMGPSSAPVLSAGRRGLGTSRR